MQNQASFNVPNITGFSEEQSILNGGATELISCPLNSKPESALNPNNNISAFPLINNIFPINNSSAIESNNQSTENANIWNSSVPEDNLTNNLSLMEETEYSFVDSSNSVGSFSNQSHEQSKHYPAYMSHELPCIIEDSTSQNIKPKTKRYRRNSLPLNTRGMKRKLSTSSDTVLACNINEHDQNSSNSSCDLTGNIESSDSATTPAWTRCYSPFRKKTTSVASSERGNSLINKLFTEEEKQRYLASKKMSLSNEPKNKSKFVGLLDSREKFSLDEVACTSSLDSTIFSNESFLSKPETQAADNPIQLDLKDDCSIPKFPTEPKINDDTVPKPPEIDVSSGTRLIDIISNPNLNKNLNFFSEISSTSTLKTSSDSNLQNKLPCLNNVVNETPEPVLDPHSTMAVPEENLSLGANLAPTSSPMVESVEMNEGSISNENFSNVEISDSLERIFNESRILESNEERVSEEVPFMFVTENVSSKNFIEEELPTNYKEPIDTLPQISESIQQECTVEEGISYSVAETVVPSVSYEDNNENTIYLDEKGGVLNVFKYKSDPVNCEIELNSEESILETTSKILTDVSSDKYDNSTDVPEIYIVPESTHESQNAQNMIDISTIDFDFLEMKKNIIEDQRMSDTIKAPDIAASNIGMEYLELHKALLEGHREDSHVPIPVIDLKNSKRDIFLLGNSKVPSNTDDNICGDSEIIIVSSDFCKSGMQVLDFEAIQEVPNVTVLEKNMDTNYSVNDIILEGNQVIDNSIGNFKSNVDKPFTEELTLGNHIPVEDSFVPIDNIDLPNSIPISNGEVDMLAYFANLGAKKASKARKSFKSRVSDLSSLIDTEINMDSSDVNMSCLPPNHILQESSMQISNSDEILNTGNKETSTESHQVSSEGSNSIRRLSLDSCGRHNRTDSSSADECENGKSKRIRLGDIDDANNSLTAVDSFPSSDSSAQRKTALKTFKKPFTVAKKSVDEKTAFKSVIQSYFGVRTALKSCSKSSNQKTRDKNGSAIIISLQDKSDVEISPEELSSEEAKNSSGSWSPMKDLSISQSICTCSATEVPCLCSNETLQLICEAEDTVDGVTVPCTKSVSQQYLLTPSAKVKHRAYCNIHLSRLRKHHCCPTCGLFCTQGIFLHCSHVHTLKSGRENHLFHPSCFIIPNIGFPPSCPHCCKFSDFNRVQLSLFDSPEQQNASQDVSMFPEGENITSDFDNYHIILNNANKEENVTPAKNSEEALQKKELHTMLMSITKEKSLSLRPTGKCLFNPIKNGDVKKVMQLIVNGVNPNHKFNTHKNNTPLHIAAFYGYVGIVHLLLQYGALIDAVNDDLETPLLLAVEKNQMAVVKCLLFAGAQVDVKNENGLTAFHLAAKNNHIEIAKVLFGTGRFDVNIQDNDGWTPLVWACEHNYLNLVHWLLELEADPNIQDNEENTALHWAACAGDCEILEMLLKQGCNLTLVNERGDSALHVAARKDHHACVKVLLSKGASLDCKNKDGVTPIMCCEKGFKSLRICKRHSSNSTNMDKISLQQNVVYRDISRGAESYPIQAVNEIDEEEFLMEFRYITKTCYLPDISVITTIDTMEKCSCKDNCNSGSCSCTKISRCWYDMDERLVADFDMHDPPAIYECSKICHCPRTCINRVVQKGLRIPLQIFRTSDRGWGVRTLKSIPKGTFVCEYIGEVITAEEVAKRSDDSYFFDLESKNGDHCIDGRFFGNVARFINHSCQPNLVSIRVFVEHQDKNFPRIAFFAEKSIDVFEELCFDYGTEFWIAKSHSVLCTCKASVCKYSKDSIDDTLMAYVAQKNINT